VFDERGQQVVKQISINSERGVFAQQESGFLKFFIKILK
jgi:hypothetical protein